MGFTGMGQMGFTGMGQVGFTGMGQVGITHMLEYKCVYSRRCSTIGLLLQTHQQLKL